MSNSAEEQLSLLKVARSAIASTQEALEGTTTWLALTDADGRVTYEWAAAPSLRRHLARADVTEGADLAHRSAGTNGVGVALATGALTIVQGTDRLDERMHNLVCAATPVLHPITRNLLTAVNVTCLAGEPNPHLKIALNMLLAGIQDSLTRLSRARHQRLLDAHLRVKAGTGAAVITLDRYTMIAEDGLGGLALDREQLWHYVEEAGPFTREFVLPTGVRAQIVPVMPPKTSEGCSLVLSRLNVAGLARSLVKGSNAGPLTASLPALSQLELAEREIIASVLSECRGNKSDAAEQLRISRGTLYERIRRYGL
ncbi:regulatory protein, Fis family [Arthrobacter sp. ok909]|uniref:helix-turn-helix domain-containing protein n=1 Tax=Arthrobacter sp. ok909 TaxID=1761746 RepID=UPI000888F968|nr:helix-turn-helix domain-containing protein [Arthrobacter sp. ok909]SDP82309.1 regulatory protein, Fis family [Arthrobacter sp. ok909]